MCNFPFPPKIYVVTPQSLQIKNCTPTQGACYNFSLQAFKTVFVICWTTSTSSQPYLFPIRSLVHYKLRIYFLTYFLSRVFFREVSVSSRAVLHIGGHHVFFMQGSRQNNIFEKRVAPQDEEPWERRLYQDFSGAKSSVKLLTGALRSENELSVLNSLGEIASY